MKEEKVLSASEVADERRSFILHTRCVRGLSDPVVGMLSRRTRFGAQIEIPGKGGASIGKLDRNHGRYRRDDSNVG